MSVTRSRRDHNPDIAARTHLARIQVQRADDLNRAAVIARGARGCDVAREKLAEQPRGDGIVPIRQSKRLYAATREPKRLVMIEGADHNDDALLAGARLIEESVGFVPAAGRRAP